MKNTYLILLTTEMYFLIVECALAPDINLEGRLIANDVSRVLQLSCTTNIAVQLCTVEFLVDKKTHDNIRYHNNNCYHTKLICYPTVCMCLGDCKSFTLNVTITPDMMNYTYSCASKIENNGVIYTANISVIQDGNGGSTIIKKIVNPSNIGRPPQQATSISPEIDMVASFSAPLIIVITACGLLFLAIFLIVMVKSKKRNTGINRHLRTDSPTVGRKDEPIPLITIISEDLPTVENIREVELVPFNRENIQDSQTVVTTQELVPLNLENIQDTPMVEYSKKKATIILSSSQDLQLGSYSEQLAKAFNPSSYDYLTGLPLEDSEQLATALNPRRYGEKSTNSESLDIHEKKQIH